MRLEVMVMVALAVPITGNVPIYYKTPITPVAWARVDPCFLPQVQAIGPWYMSDLRTKTPPRISFRINGVYKQLTLNRFVAVIARGARLNLIPIGTVITREQAWTEANQLPAVGFNDQDQFNCEVSNLRLGANSLFIDVDLSGVKQTPGVVEVGYIPPVENFDPVGDEAVLPKDNTFGPHSSTVRTVRDILRQTGN
jgi:hypothetical protein